MADRSTKLQREVGGLALSCVQSSEPMLRVQAAHWTNALRRLGLRLPLWVVHDLGTVATTHPQQVSIGPRPVAAGLALDASARRDLDRWSETVQEVSRSEVATALRRRSASDSMLCAILAHVLGPVALQPALLGDRWKEMLPIDPAAYRVNDEQLARWFASAARSEDIEHLARLANGGPRLLLALEQLDLDTVRLLDMFDGTGNGADIVDLMAVLERVDVNDVVDFSLDLLPSVLEAHRTAGVQAFGMNGYMGVERHGTLDSLVMSELALDPDLLARRYAENELTYYAREKRRDEPRRLCCVAVDATAAMRGQRSVFARGLALALAKRLALRGDEVRVCFFDSRLYPPIRVASGRGDGTHVPQVLTFRGEHGRNYGKVFTLLANDLEQRARRRHKAPILYVLTHAECHLPREVLERLRAAATLFGVFILPSMGHPDIDHLDLFHATHVVDADTLRERGARARRALSIVAEATRQEQP